MGKAWQSIPSSHRSTNGSSVECLTTTATLESFSFTASHASLQLMMMTMPGAAEEEEDTNKQTHTCIPHVADEMRKHGMNKRYANAKKKVSINKDREI